MMIESKIKPQDLTREKLLSSAFCEIHRNGYQGASIANILASTGLTKGALYHHFPTKHALGLAVVNEVIAPHLENHMFKQLRTSAYPVTTLLDIIAGAGDFIGDAGIMSGCPLNNLMQEMSQLDEQFRCQLNGILEAWQQSIHGALLHGQKNHIIKTEIDIHAAALFIVSAWEGCFSIAKNKQSPEAFTLCMTQLHGYVQSLMK